jgi:SnoaL-like domain
MAKRSRQDDTGESKTPNDPNDQVLNLSTTVISLLARVQALEDTTSIRHLHHAYGYYIDKCLYPSVVDLVNHILITEDNYNHGKSCSLTFSSSRTPPKLQFTFSMVFVGIDRGSPFPIFDCLMISFSSISNFQELLSSNYPGKGKPGISRLYVEWFGTLFTGGRNTPLKGFLLEHLMMQDIITINPDTSPRTAKARFRTFMQGGFHESVKQSERSEDVPSQFWEGGVYENEYVFEDGVWKIFKLGYNMLWQADYGKGWSGSEAMKGLEKCWPADKWGPDELVAGKKVWPETRVVQFHYAHPVTGARVGE